jgi:aspartyl-tRNA(Asn)/glutamyl-tRNA(Gln) amidotransferase subunit C
MRPGSQPVEGSGLYTRGRMAISRTEVQHVAHLARLGLTDEEMDRMAVHLNHILEAMETLKELDTSAIPPTAQVIPLRSVMREDVARPSWPSEEVLRNAPRHERGQFRVPEVFE